MKKILVIFACVILASCASQKPSKSTAVELISKSYPADAYMANLHPVSDSELRLRKEAVFNGR